MSFIKELDGSGYIDRLYKSQPVAAAAPAEPARAAAPAAPPTKEKPASKDKPVAVAKATKEKTPPADKPAAPADKSAATTKASGAPAETPVELPKEYTVRAGDTLSKIAGQFYGSMQKWQKIYQANSETVKNPDYIFIGQKLTIPADDAEQKKG